MNPFDSLPLHLTDPPQDYSPNETFSSTRNF